MKIIISPSKTKKLSKLSEMKEFKEILFADMTNKIIKEISNFKREEIEIKFKLKYEAAEELLEFYKNYENEEYGHALASYTGIAYKAIKIQEFNENDINFAEENLLILSALYGVLTPLTKLKKYRLDMINSIFKEKSLYELWKKEINDYLINEKLIINLASKEYSKIVESQNMYNFEFYTNEKGKLRQISTNSKKMRGFTVNHIVKNKIKCIEELRNITLNEYKYSKELSSEKKLIYIKFE